jgi:hypothetical protein
MFLFRRIGVYTYSLYVFHGLFIAFLHKPGLISTNLLASIRSTILFGLFFVGAGITEEMFNKKFNIKSAVRSFIRRMAW